MKRRDILLLTLAAVMFVTVLEYANACSCMPMHPQEHYCKSDFVILARVKRSKQLNETMVYKVRVRKEYKLSEKAVVALKSGRLLTASNGAMCGSELQVGKLYVISGRVHSLRAHINLCGLNMEWENLTRRQRKGFKMMYKHGCTCQINNCMHRRCAGRMKDMCKWTSDCHTKEGICLRQANKTCMWTRNMALTKCMKNNPLTISLWSG